MPSGWLWDTAPKRRRPTPVLPAALALDDPISSLGASGQGDVGTCTASRSPPSASSPPLLRCDVTRARRISPRVRRRIVELRAAVLTRFADELADERPTAPSPTTTDLDRDRRRPGGHRGYRSGGR